MLYNPEQAPARRLPLPGNLTKPCFFHVKDQISSYTFPGKALISPFISICNKTAANLLIL